MEMWNSIHFHGIPIKGTLLISIFTIHSEAKSPFYLLLGVFKIRHSREEKWRTRMTALTERCNRKPGESGARCSQQTSPSTPHSSPMLGKTPYAENFSSRYFINQLCKIQTPSTRHLYLLKNIILFVR